MNNNKQNTAKGTSLLTTIQIVFIILKLTNLINWSWWIVLIPTYIMVLIVIVFIIFALIYYKHISKPFVKKKSKRK